VAKHSWLIGLSLSLSLLSWFLSFGRDISHVRKTVQPDLCYHCRYSEPAEVRFRFDILRFRPCMGKVWTGLKGYKRSPH
jgi:hypothetical protein